MSMNDPFKLIRNTATLEAYRQHQRAMRAAAQPWLTIAVVGLFTTLLGEGLCFRALSSPNNSAHINFSLLSLFSSLLVIVPGFALVIAGIRARRYSRSHPLKLPDLSKGEPWLRSIPSDRDATPQP